MDDVKEIAKEAGQLIQVHNFLTTSKQMNRKTCILLLTELDTIYSKMLKNDNIHKSEAQETRQTNEH